MSIVPKYAMQHQKRGPNLRGSENCQKKFPSLPLVTSRRDVVQPMQHRAFLNCVGTAHEHVDPAEHDHDEDDVLAFAY